MSATGDPRPRIERVRIDLLRVPLHEPYRLAFGDLTAFDTLLVELTAADGRQGFGEATVLTGYTDESIASAWALAGELASRLVSPGIAPEALFAETVPRAPFATTAFGAALDMLESHPALRPSEQVRVPLLALLQGRDSAEWAERIDRFVEEGYTTLKVKVGYDKGADLAKVARMQALLGGRARLRLDANQAFTASEAIDFVQRLDPAGIELLEQPCPADDWESHAAVAAVSAVPLMLDESIYGIADIERAADGRLAHYVKLKLMKMGGIRPLEAALERIRARGLQAVLGNGVACDPNCWMEACVAARHIDNAGEMNGFLKARVSLFEEPLAVRRGAIVLDPARPPRLDRDAIATCTSDRRDVHAKLHAA
jgi:o-succinylbenzoate synthase